MPKKVKKSKTEKPKKGSKSKSTVKEAKKESVLKDAAANAMFWERKLESSERVRREYRENAKQLLTENETLQDKLAQSEKDTIQVISFLKSEDLKKEEQIVKSDQKLKECTKKLTSEKDSLIESYTQQIQELGEALEEKGNEVKLMQSELRLVKEFRKKRAQMQRELDEIKDGMFSTEKKHKDILGNMEEKFFEEKIRLQQEANRKIAELAERAHAEAVSNLDETTRSVYKENVRVNAALEYHVAESKDLKKVKETLEVENQELETEKELNGMIVQEKVVESKHQKKLITELREKVETLEKSLSHIIREFEVERLDVVKKADEEHQNSRVEIARLKKVVELKTKEMNRVKRLARNILDQRTEIEHFFLDSLEYVKNEIAKNRSQYRKDAQVAYQQRMIAAHSGRANYPKVRTFNQWDTSTNSVFNDLKEAETWAGIEGKVDISDLTWEQRERVLRLLFAKINGHKSKSRRTTRRLEREQESRICIPEEPHSSTLPELGQHDSTFLTQQSFNEAEIPQAFSESKELSATAR